MTRLFCVLLLVLVSCSASAEMQVITLKHRTAAEILPVVRPLLDRGGVASGMDSQLILRTSKHNIAEIRKLLDKIDVAPRRLRIIVLQNVDSETVKRLTEMSGSVSLGSARATVSGRRGDEGLTFEAGKGEARARARIYTTRSLDSDRKRQQVMVLEGHRALIRTGQSVPVQQHREVVSPWGAQVTDSTRYRDVNSGFYVLPRVSGDRVTLEVTAQNDALQPHGESGATNVQNVTTTVSGRLGEWLVLGDSGQQGNDDGSSVSVHTTSRSRESRNILLKVEEVH